MKEALNEEHCAAVSPGASAGQAIVEFAIALIAVIALLAGLIQIGQLAHARMRTIGDARAEAGRRALNNLFQGAYDARMICEWTPGPDTRAHTYDDLPESCNNAVVLPGGLVANAALERVPGAPANPLATLAESPNPAGSLFLVKGKAFEPVDILPAIRRLVFKPPSLDVESEAWLVWAEGIY